MESSKVVIDTNIFIEYLRAKDRKNTNLYKIPSNKVLYISSVTLYELLMGAYNERKREDIRLLTQDIIILPFDEQVCSCSAEIYHDLRRNNKMIEFRDIFIAATCIFHKLPLKTSNKNHFKRVRGLKLE